MGRDRGARDGTGGEGRIGVVMGWEEMKKRNGAEMRE